MRTIAETPKHERYLMVAERISPAAWTTLCQSVRDYLANNPDRNRSTCSDADMLRFIDTPLKQTSHPFVVLFAYADVPANTKWNVAFDPSNDSPIEITNAALCFGVFWKRIAIPTLSHGHHQVAVIDFPDGLPAVIASLPIDADRQSSDHVRLCSAEDLDAIRSQHEIVA